MPLGVITVQFAISFLLIATGELLELLSLTTVKEVDEYIGGHYGPHWSQFAMPAAWEKRLVQTSAATGEEVLLVRRANEAGFWVVHTSRGIQRVRLADRRIVRTIQQGPKRGVAYSPAEIMGDERKQQIMDSANHLVTTN